MTSMDFDQWVTGAVTAQWPAGGMAAIDSAVIRDLARLLIVDEAGLALTVRRMLDVYGVPAPVYEIGTGSWRVDLLPETAKAVLSDTIAVTVLRHLGTGGFPAAVLAAMAALLFSIHRVEINPGELVLHARLSDGGATDRGDLSELYRTLPHNVRAELTIAELADLTQRVDQLDRALWDEGAVTLVETAQGQKVRLVVREPGPGPAVSRPRAAAGQRSEVSRKVFVIHGRDEQARRTIFELLRAVDLQPQEWEPLVAETGSTLPSLNEVIATGLAGGQAQAVLAILTPDDIVTLHPSLQAPNDPADETSLAMQPRPNVLIELGMALSAYRRRTIVVEIGLLRRIADLDGLNVIRFDGSDRAIGKLVERLKLAGCAVHDKGSDWRETRRFAALDAYARRPPAAK